MSLRALIATCVCLAQGQELSSSIGATHWDPCYFTDGDVPVLLNGAQQLRRMETTAIKLTFASDPPYLWNTFGNGKHGHWDLTNYSSLAELASHPWYESVFNQAYQTYALVTNRFGTGLYFCQGPMTADNITAEVDEFEALTALLLATYEGSGKRFIYQHWEGDWAVRCGSYNASKPASPQIQANMIQWLLARQKGTSSGRVKHCRHMQEQERAGGSSSRWLGLDCLDERLVLAKAGVEVFHASEVNLVAAAMKGEPENILQVIPKLQLDMVSYSSYDTMATPQFGKALDFIAAHHVPTPASPSPAVYIGEYGLAESRVPVPTVQAVLQNVIGFALSVNSRGVRRAAHALWWEMYDNEDDCSPNQRCHGSEPCFNTSCLAGFWLVRPNNTVAVPWTYLQGVINGTLPVPSPPSPDQLPAIAPFKRPVDRYPRGY